MQCREVSHSRLSAIIFGTQGNGTRLPEIADVGAQQTVIHQPLVGSRRAAEKEGGLMIGAGLEDLGKGLRSQVGTLYGTLAKGTRYLELTEGYITRMALDKDNEVIG